ncbi:MAG: DUF4445 domain-containing protein [Lachnospiraceae bacterium]|nr:DUF4445 domain-containing protein [Lachnospiraceae bacterium]
MGTLTVFTAKGKQNIAFDGTPTVQQVLEHSGISMAHPCGGTGKCGKCAIDVIGNVSLPDETERSAGCRLSCRTRLYGDAIVTLKEQNDSSLIAEGFEKNIKPIENFEYRIGAAVDIGTTTIALSIYDLTTGNCLATKTMLNPQSVISADVIGRIDAAVNGKLTNMQNMLISGIHALAEETGYLNRIDTWCLTGNTTMLYLLCGRNPQSFATAPYMADHFFGEEISFLGKPAYLPPCMHAFVGADITCAVLAGGMCDDTKTVLLCDIGTNGEIALWKDGTLYVTSTAAGPVFEGAGISYGCQSVTGAIEKVELNSGSLAVKTIGATKPIGLCGSGVIDTIACLLNNNTIDETGAMEPEEFLLCEGISINRQDIRNIQLAKAAISAGIRTLLEVTKTSEEEISAFYLAGGFGKHLNMDSAIRIGLFPASLRNKVRILGNAALKGAASMLTDESLKGTAQMIAGKAEYLSLPDNPDFCKNYIEELSFKTL